MPMIVPQPTLTSTSRSGETQKSYRTWYFAPLASPCVPRNVNPIVCIAELACDASTDGGGTCGSGMPEAAYGLCGSSGVGLPVVRSTGRKYQTTRFSHIATTTVSSTRPMKNAGMASRHSPRQTSSPMDVAPAILQFADSPLPVVLIDGDHQPTGCLPDLRSDRRPQPLANIAGQELGGGVGNGQEGAVAAGKDPAAAVGRKDRLDFAAVIGHPDQRVACRQEHAVIEVVEDRLELVAEGDEADNVLVLVERPFHFYSHAVVMPVQPLADVAGERDEMRGTEDVVLFFEADAVGHGSKFKVQSQFQGGGSRPSRSPANKTAAIRSAVAPGLRRLPSARSQKSKSVRAAR